MKAFKIDVSGKVQGVFYRAHTINKAKELILKGTVKNMRDGSVQIIAEGAEENLLKLVNWCRIGPLLSEVTAVNVTEITPMGFDNFKII